MTRLLCLFGFIIFLGSHATAEPLQLLAQPGPWPAVSGLISFDGRLWLVNSDPYVNHNAADIYSYDPGHGDLRYEAALFSQGAGDPVVFDGRLFWPFEDPRFSALRGEYMVTDGAAWRWHALADGLAFHVHAMANLGGKLCAATSAWRAGLQVSDDGGATWRILYDHPTPESRVSRITALEAAHSTLYAGLTDRRVPGPRLLRLEGDTLVPAEAWPEGRRVDQLAAHRAWLYGTNVTANGSALWRTDGIVAERVHALDGHAVRDLAAGADALWAVTVDANGEGRLWRTSDGESWQVAHTFAGASPTAVALHAGQVYVGARGPHGRGSLWGPAAPAATVSLPSAMALPLETTPPDAAFSLAELDRALADPTSYAEYGAGLRAALAPFLGRRSPALGAALSERLAGPFPDITLQLFSTAFVVTATEMAQWGLLRAIALTGHGRIPPALIVSPWRAARNDAEKYFEPAPAAAWAVAQIGQNDTATLAALIARLDMPSDPDWLAGDMIAALTTLTGHRFGHDIPARLLRQPAGPRLARRLVPRAGRLHHLHPHASENQFHSARPTVGAVKGRPCSGWPKPAGR